MKLSYMILITLFLSSSSSLFALNLDFELDDAEECAYICSSRCMGISKDLLRLGRSIKKKCGDDTTDRGNSYLIPFGFNSPVNSKRKVS